MTKVVTMTLYALLNIHFLMSHIMDNKKRMYVGFSSLPTLSLCVFRQRNGGSWCGTLAH
jgi:hypothetical protein